jgi:hypothetical protein
MTLVGLDLNATRARAVTAPAGAAPRPLPLDGVQADLPLALSLEGKHPEVGRAGVGLCRRLPHLACLDFLTFLGEPREWTAGRHRLDAAKALGLVLERLQPACATARGLVLALPAYLTRTQVALLMPLAEKARLPVLGSVVAPLAAALAACGEQPWSRPALVVDADEHALTLAVVSLEAEQARVLTAHALPQLGLRVWKGRLLDAAADSCIRHSRRDPRDSAAAEQALYEQLDAAMDACRQGPLVEFLIQTAHWYQNLMLRSEEVVAFCSRLASQARESARAVFAAVSAGTPSAIILTEAAGRLPGLVAALEGEVADPPLEVFDEPPEDFGENLLLPHGSDPRSVIVLGPDAVARTAQQLASNFLRGDLPRGHLDTVVPLLVAHSDAAGPARLHFRGRDYLLGRSVFVLGRQSGCDLVVDGTLHPDVAPRHCELAPERRSYVLRDRSRAGTLVNDRPVRQQVILRPGDWIRLGPDGPLIRFLGQASDDPKLGTIA